MEIISVTLLEKKEKVIFFRNSMCIVVVFVLGKRKVTHFEMLSYNPLKRNVALTHSALQGYSLTCTGQNTPNIKAFY